MPSEEFISSYVDAETALRRQILLRGYELGSGGQRLEPEAAVAFLEEHYQPIYLDALAAIREERHDLKRAGEAEVSKFKADLQSLRDQLRSGLEGPSRRGVRGPSSAQQRAGWQTVPAALLAHQLVVQPTMVAVRKEQRRGIAVVRRQPRRLWEWIQRKEGKVRLAVNWEDGTSTILSDNDDISWCPVVVPDQGSET